MPYSPSTDIDTAMESAQSAASDWKDKVADTANQALDKAGELGRNLGNKIDESRAPAADMLEDAATRLHAKAESIPGGDTTTGMAHRTADQMRATAQYVRENNLQRMWSDGADCVRRNPGSAILTALVGGFLLGRTLRSGRR